MGRSLGKNHQNSFATMSIYKVLIIFLNRQGIPNCYFNKIKFKKKINKTFFFLPYYEDSLFSTPRKSFPSMLWKPKSKSNYEFGSIFNKAITQCNIEKFSSTMRSSTLYLPSKAGITEQLLTKVMQSNIQFFPNSLTIKSSYGKQMNSN